MGALSQDVDLELDDGSRKAAIAIAWKLHCLDNRLDEVEQRLAEEHGISILLMSDKAMSQTKSPFRTVATLSDWIEEMAK